MIFNETVAKDIDYMTFDGATDYIKTTINTEDLDHPTTFEFWMKVDEEWHSDYLVSGLLS